jgi:predicted Fe-Mo cluster-binding NifX family protein
MIVCAPVTTEGMIDSRWSRADWIAVAEVVNGDVVSWREVEVSWSRVHDEPGSHHDRVAIFLQDNNIEALVADQICNGMARMMDTMGLPVHLGSTGDAKVAVKALGLNV